MGTFQSILPCARLSIFDTNSNSSSDLDNSDPNGDDPNQVRGRGVAFIGRRIRTLSRTNVSRISASLSEAIRLVEFLPGSKFLIKYKIQRRDRPRGNKIAYAKHKWSKKKVILKFFEDRDKFENAMRFAEAFDNEYFCKQLDSCDNCDGPYPYCIVYEREKKAVLHRVNNPVHGVLQLARTPQIGKALDLAHSENMAIRVIRPADIMRFGSKWKLTKFDCVGQIGEEAPAGYLGMYTAPEVVKVSLNQGTVSIRAAHDIWALGIISYEVFCDGRGFFDGMEIPPLQWLDALTDTSQITCRTWDLCDVLEKSLVERSLKINPEERITASSYAESIESCVHEEENEVMQRTLYDYRTQIVQGHIKVERATLQKLDPSEISDEHNEEARVLYANRNTSGSNFDQIRPDRVCLLTVELRARPEPPLVKICGVISLTAEFGTVHPYVLEPLSEISPAVCTIRACISSSQLPNDFDLNETITADFKIELQTNIIINEEQAGTGHISCVHCHNNIYFE